MPETKEPPSRTKDFKGRIMDALGFMKIYAKNLLSRPPKTIKIN